jgi:hypothetical protein
MKRAGFTPFYQFVAIGMLAWACLSGVVFAQEAAAIPEDVWQVVDPRVRYRPVPLPRKEDGFDVLAELAKLKVVEPSITDDRELHDAYFAVLDGERRFPDGELGERLKKLIDDNAEGVKLFDQFAKFRGVRFPDLFNLPVQGLRPFMRVRELQIAQQQAQGKFDRSAAWLNDIQHVATMLQESEGGLLAWLLGVSIEARGLALMARLAADPACPVEQIEAWQRQVLDQRKRSPQSLAQCLRRDFFEVVLSQLAKLPADATLAQAVSATVGQHRPKEPNFWKNLRFTLREWQVLVLLCDHPAPFDRDKTIQLASQRLVEVIRVLELDRSQSGELADDELQRVAKLWPESMGLDVFSVLALHLGGGGTSWDSWEEFWNEVLATAEAAEQLAEIPNAFGKYFLAIHSDPSNADSLAVSVVRLRVRVEATVAMLAIRRFERRQQRLPKVLQELVDAKLLTEVPRDPIDDQPLRYDPERRRLWSIGLDGEDHGGVQYFGSGAEFFSMLRKLLPKDDAKKLPPAPVPRPQPGGSDIVYSLDGQTVADVLK